MFTFVQVASRIFAYLFQRTLLRLDSGFRTPPWMRGVWNPFTVLPSPFYYSISTIIYTHLPLSTLHTHKHHPTYIYINKDICKDIYCFVGCWSLSRVFYWCTAACINLSVNSSGYSFNSAWFRVQVFTSELWNFHFVFNFRCDSQCRPSPGH